jgi:hypothetical protein
MFDALLTAMVGICNMKTRKNIWMLLWMVLLIAGQAPAQNAMKDPFIQMTAHEHNKTGKCNADFLNRHLGVVQKFEFTSQDRCYYGTSGADQITLHAFAQPHEQCQRQANRSADFCHFLTINGNHYLVSHRTRLVAHVNYTRNTVSNVAPKIYIFGLQGDDHIDLRGRLYNGVPPTGHVSFQDNFEAGLQEHLYIYAGPGNDFLVGSSGVNYLFDEGGCDTVMGVDQANDHFYKDGTSDEDCNEWLNMDWHLFRGDSSGN